MTSYAEEPLLHVDEIVEKWTNQCGSCDLGLPEYGCNHPDEDYRPVMLTLVREVQRLQAELARWESGQRRKGLPVVESVPDGLHYAALLVRAVGTEGGEEHDGLLYGAAVRLKALSDACSYLLAEVGQLRAQRGSLLVAAKAVVDAGRCAGLGSVGAALVAAVEAVGGDCD